MEKLKFEPGFLWHAHTHTHTVHSSGLSKKITISKKFQSALKKEISYVSKSW
jgi:hypothetical protein